MFGIDNYLGFLVAGILLNITPGSDTMYVLGRSIAQGKKAGIYSALGIAAGCFFHIFLAAFGLSIIIQKSPFLFNILKYAGALYLIYLGINMLLSKPNKNFDINGNTPPISLQKIFVSGVITNVLNPKVALFFIAFLPQFVQKNYENPALSFLILGCTFNITGTLWNSFLAISAAKMTANIKNNPSAQVILDRLTGVVFIALSIRLAFQQR